MEITFPHRLAVEARHGGFTIRTDQPEEAGGDDSAPSPFDLFLASLGTCAGYFALRFCRERELPTEGLKLSMETEKDPEKHRLARVRLTLRLPEDFPPKYRRAIVKAVDQCTVKRTLLDPPDFEVLTE